MKSFPLFSATLALLSCLAVVPAYASKVDGLWCGTGLLHEFSLSLAQQAQDVTGTLARRDRRRELHGQLDGNVLRTQATKFGALVLEVEGTQLRITGGDGPLALAQGMVFTRAKGEACAG